MKQLHLPDSVPHAGQSEFGNHGFRGGPVLACLLMLTVPAAAVAASGDLVWQKVLHQSYSCPYPVVSGGSLFTQLEEFDREFRPRPGVRSFDPADGKVLWSAHGGREWIPSTVVGPGMAAANGRVFAAEERGGDGKSLSGIASITAYDASSGEELWAVRLDDRVSGYLLSAIAANRDALYAVGRRWSQTIAADGTWSSEAMLLAIDGATGTLLWSAYFNPGGGFDEAINLGVGGGLVVSSVADLRPSGGSSVWVRAHDAASGRLAWEDRVLKGEPQRLVIDRGRVYTMGWRQGRRHSFLVAHDLVTGDRLWQRRARNTLGQWLDASRRAVALYGFDASGGFAGPSGIRVYDGATGKRLWKREVGETLLHVFAHGKTLYSIGDRERGGAQPPSGFVVRAHRMRSGRPLWFFRANDPEREELGCQIAVAGGLLVTTGYGSPGSVMRAFEP